MPQPVYATGPDITTDECQRIVRSLITVQCMNMNNCIDTQLSDIRPTIMLQLSRMSGGNYATACSGYLDGIFNEYISQYANAAPRGVATSFPTATTPNHNIGVNSQIEIKNPLVQEKPEWATEMQERKQELQDLQSQNGTNDYGIYANAFPTTYADISFSERMGNAQAGYEPFKDTSAYTTLKIETEKEYITRQQDIERLKNPPTETSNTNSQPQSSQTTKQTTTSTQQPQTTQPPQPKETPSEDTPSEDTLPENNEVELPEGYKPVHSKDNDQKGEFAILFSPRESIQSAENKIYETDEHNNKVFWHKKCADQSYYMYYDDSTDINSLLHKSPLSFDDTTDYFLSTSSPIGLLMSDRPGFPYPVRQQTENDIHKLALWLIKILKNSNCAGLDIYTVKVTQIPNTRQFNINKIISGPYNID